MNYSVKHMQNAYYSQIISKTDEGKCRRNVDPLTSTPLPFLVGVPGPPEEAEGGDDQDRGDEGSQHHAQDQRRAARQEVGEFVSLSHQ